MDMGLGLRRRRHMSPPRRNGAPHREDIASDHPPSPAQPSALSAGGHPSLQRTDQPVHAPAAPTASALDSYASEHLGHPADHSVRALLRLHTSDSDIHCPVAPFASVLYPVRLVISPAPSTGESRSYAYTMNEARFTRDNVLYEFSPLCLGAIRRTMKDIEDEWDSGFKTFFILMMVACFGMIEVGVMANTLTRMSETINMISAVMSRTSFILSSCLLLITVSFLAGGHGFISGIAAALFIMIVMVSAWKSRDPTTATVVSTFFSSCLSKIRVGRRSWSQPILPL